MLNAFENAGGRASTDAVSCPCRSDAARRTILSPMRVVRSATGPSAHTAAPSSGVARGAYSSRICLTTTPVDQRQHPTPRRIRPGDVHEPELHAVQLTGVVDDPDRQAVL